MTIRTLERTPGFKRALKKFAKNNPILREKIDKALREMLNDPFAPFLATHRLGGKLSGFLACTCGYNCRILFSIEKDKTTGNENIILLSVGTHDEVY